MRLRVKEEWIRALRSGEDSQLKRHHVDYIHDPEPHLLPDDNDVNFSEIADWIDKNL